MEALTESEVRDIDSRIFAASVESPEPENLWIEPEYAKKYGMEIKYEGDYYAKIWYAYKQPTGNFLDLKAKHKRTKKA